MGPHLGWILREESFNSGNIFTSGSRHSSRIVSLDRQLGFRNLQNKQNRYGIHLIDILPWRILALKRSCPASTTATAETYHLFNHIHQRWPGQWPGQFNQMKFPNLVRRAIQQSYSESSLAGTAQSSARQLSCPPGMLSSSFKSGTRPCRARSCCQGSLLFPKI